MNDDESSQFAHDLKTQLWGEPEEDMEMYREKYSPVTGEVYDDWSFAEFMLNRMAGCKPTSTRNAHTTLRR